MNNNDKKEVINLIDNLNAISFYELNEHSKECYYEIRNAILAMPEQEPKTGHWIVLSPTDMYCSECHEIEHLDTSRKFCAFCGAKMVEPQESEDKNE